MTSQSSADFSYAPIETSGTVRIQVTCNKCGESKTTSSHDHSIEQWQQSHTCKERHYSEAGGNV